MRTFFAEIFGKIIAEIFVFLVFLVSLPIKLVDVTVRFFKQKAKTIWVSGPKYSFDQGTGFIMGIPEIKKKPWPSRKQLQMIGSISLLVVMILVAWFQWPSPKSRRADQLYLLHEAGQYISDTGAFEAKVREVGRNLDVPPEWLMAVMYSESRFNPSVLNHKGSGATGLIQFMVPAVKDLNRRLGTSYYMSDIRQMPATDQLLLVQEYLQTMRERYGEFESLTDLYLAILYPKALENTGDYVMYSKPSRMYTQNSGLDENKDGSVSVGDIDKRMKRIFPIAYMAEK